MYVGISVCKNEYLQYPTCEGQAKLLVMQSQKGMGGIKIK